MSTFAQLHKKFSELDLKKEAVSVIVAHKPEIVEFNKSQLLNDGETKLGVKLKKYKSDAYARKKNRRNPSPGLGNPDLYDKGDFFDGMTVKIIDENKYEITSTDSKTNALIKKYGKDILGLSVASRVEMVKDFFRSDFNDRIRLKTGL